MTRHALAALAAITLASGALAAQGNEEFARRQYESGLAFMQNGRYNEALKDFEAVIESKSSVADNALLQVALYYLDVAHDITASQSAVNRLLKDFLNTDSAPMAYVLSGRIAMSKGRTPADVDAALAAFERVPRLFPNDDAVPAAGFYAGETLRVVRRTDEALERFRRVSLEYPRSPWAVRARLRAALCLVPGDRAPRALDELQWVRQQLPNSPEAADALNLNTILYRLYVRLPAQPAYAFNGRYKGGEGTKFKDVFGLAFDAAGQLLVGHKLGVTVFDAKGAVGRTVAADDPSAFFIDERGRVVVARRDLLIAERAESTPIRTSEQDGKVRQVEEIPSAAALSTGDRLVVDHKGKAVIRITPTGSYAGKFAAIDAEKLAINRLDDVAVIDRESKSVAVFDRDGKALTRIPQKGPGYELDHPVDVQFDPFGHLYVLDRGRASMFVFGARNKLMTTVTIPEKSPGAFQKAAAFALDRAGRLYIFDERAQTIQVYQ